MYETDRLILRKAEFRDWQAMYRNVWSNPDAAGYTRKSLAAPSGAARDSFHLGSTVSRISFTRASLPSPFSAEKGITGQLSGSSRSWRIS